MNSCLLKGDNKSSDITFDKGTGDYTEVDDACEFMNDYIADIGVNLYNQFVNSPRGQDYTKVYNGVGSVDDIIFDRDDILYVVNNINVHKSSGIDYLPTFVLKDCFSVLLDQLVYLFNQSIALGAFPDSWKTATITPIPKSGD